MTVPTCPFSSLPCLAYYHNSLSFSEIKSSDYSYNRDPTKVLYAILTQWPHSTETTAFILLNAWMVLHEWYIHTSHFYLCINQLMEKWLFPFSAIMNNAAINMGVQMSLQYTNFISPGYTSKSRTAGSYVKCRLCLHVWFLLLLTVFYVGYDSVKSQQ